METLFEKEVIKHLNLPSIPKKEWDGKSSFDKGVAVLKMRDEREAYGICSFDAQTDKSPRIVKVFRIEPFVDIKKVFVVPAYMTTEEEIKDMDLDEQSKKKVQQVLDEAKEIENEGTKEENPMENLPEWIFEEIHSKDEAVAWLRNFQSRNKQKGRIPTTDENIKLRLFSIYSELQKKQK
jgi:hypothetical protein